VFERDGQSLHVGITERLRKQARKDGVWKSRGLCATLKNPAYGFDNQQDRSLGGADGMFLLDRSYKPPQARTAMMRKLFDHFMDKLDSGVQELAGTLDVRTDDLLPVRLVSHHTRLLGVLCRKADTDWLILVDCDQTK